MAPHFPPRYWLARLTCGLWRGFELDESHPLAGDHRQLAQSIGESIAQLKVLEQRVNQGLEHIQRVREAEALGEKRVEHAQRLMSEAMEAAGARFCREHPVAQSLEQAKARLEEAQRVEQAVTNEGSELERKHGCPQMAGLLAKRYGTSDYRAGRMEKWVDDRTAQKIGFLEFTKKQSQLMVKLEQARAQRQAAQADVDTAHAQMEQAWASSGLDYMDPHALGVAQHWQQLAQMEETQLAPMLEPLDQENSLARRALVQALFDFHRQHGRALLAFTQKALEHNCSEFPGPRIDPTAFCPTQARTQEDHQRVDVIRKTHLAFLGQCPWPELDVPAWMVLAYGHTEGLPGASMVQANMGAAELLDL